jgi:uncharacterized protein (DUF1697 family)
MARYVAFLRAINVGGHVVTMPTLRNLFEGLGLEEVETFIASGNVIFTSPPKDERALARRIERQLEKALGYEVHTFLRTCAEVEALARYRPFDAARIKSAKALYVGFLAEPLTAAGTKLLATLSSPVDDFHTAGREVFWLARALQSESAFNNAVFERRFAVRATWRNVNTVVRLATKYGSARS